MGGSVVGVCFSTAFDVAAVSDACTLSVSCFNWNMSSFSNYLRLMRSSLLPTAWSNVLLGFAISTFPEVTSSNWWALPWLLLCSSGLYLGGMVMNDLFDYEEDRHQRPERVLPSGFISLRQAQRLMLLLIAVGVLSAIVASIVAGNKYWTPLIMALTVLFFITLYNRYAKHSPFGPFVMGLCRSGNVLLGASLIEPSSSFPYFSMLSLYVAGAMGLYVAGITWFAREEHQKSSRVGLLTGTGLILLAVLALMALPHSSLWTSLPDTEAGKNPFNQRPLLFDGLLFMMVLPVFRHLANAISTGDARDVKKGVVISLLTIIMIDASVCYLFSSDTPVFALSVALLIIPAWLGCRRIMGT